MPLKNLLDSTRDALNLLMEEAERSRRELEQAGLPLDTFAAVMQAREHLDRGLQSPRVRIAVTGTTSSGKSSLLNFLCGEELLPTGVQEKSAGLVRIVHDEHVRLEIAATPGCRWECGVWDDISGEDIQTRLDAVMDAFLKERDAGNRPAPPSAVIHYPTWLGKQLGIQEQAGLELLDLPGLRSCRDDGLNDLVRECRDALCLVTFSAEDSDSERRRKSMTQVLDEVRALGGNTRRLLFVATRTDAFLARDAAHWPDNEKAFLASCAGEILPVLSDAAGTGATEKPAVIRLSPQPALFTQQFRDENIRMGAWKKIRSSYLFLVESEACNGIEERIGDAEFEGRSLIVSAGRFAPKSYRVRLAAPAQPSKLTVNNTPVKLDYNITAYSTDEFFTYYTIDKALGSFAAELIPSTIDCDGVTFAMGEANTDDAVCCDGQTVTLPSDRAYTKLYVLASSVEEPREAEFRIGDAAVQVEVPLWKGHYGQWGWRGNSEGYMKRAKIGYLGTHRHQTDLGNVPYGFSYMYLLAFDIPEGAATVTLPKDKKVLVYAMTVSDNTLDDVRLASRTFIRPDEKL